jgi:hypothetical protein
MDAQLQVALISQSHFRLGNPRASARRAAVACVMTDLHMHHNRIRKHYDYGLIDLDHWINCCPYYSANAAIKRSWPACVADVPDLCIVFGDSLGRMNATLPRFVGVDSAGP